MLLMHLAGVQGIHRGWTTRLNAFSQILCSLKSLKYSCTAAGSHPKLLGSANKRRGTHCMVLQHSRPITYSLNVTFDTRTG